MNQIFANLTAKKKELDTYKPFPPELIKNLNDWYRIELTYTSNAIEGNTLTRQETALVVDDGITVSGKSLQDQLEAVNHAQACDFIEVLAKKKRQDISLKEILNIHKKILSKIDDKNAGQFRNVSVRIKGSETVLPTADKVPQLMAEFVIWLQAPNSDNPIKIAADAHFKLVSIHPFIDGNGRTSRLLMNLLLIQAGYPPIFIKKEDRNIYIKSLEEGQTKGNLIEYNHLIAEAVDRSLDIYLEAVNPQRQLDSSHRFYTTEEVANTLRVDPESVRRYVRSGKLKAVRLGGKFIRIEKNDLQSFIEQSKTK